MLLFFQVVVAIGGPQIQRTVPAWAVATTPGFPAHPCVPLLPFFWPDEPSISFCDFPSPSHPSVGSDANPRVYQAYYGITSTARAFLRPVGPRKSRAQR